MRVDDKNDNRDDKNVGVSSVQLSNVLCILVLQNFRKKLL